MFLILDIETTKNTTTYTTWAQNIVSKGLDLTKEFPPPITHKLVCLGYMAVGDNYEIQALGSDLVDDKTTEIDILRSLNSFMDQNDITLVTWNGRAFDMPVLSYRCLCHKIPMLWYTEKFRYRYGIDKHFDLSDYLSNFGASPRAHFDCFAKLIGLPGKMEVNGANVWQLCEESRYREVASYCVTDVIQEYLAFLHVMMMRGFITTQKLEELLKKSRKYIESTGEFSKVVRDGCMQLIGKI